MLNFSYDEERDILTIEDLKYSGDLFRAFAHEKYLALNQPFEIVNRDNDTITIHKIQEDEGKA
jgi:hypothetical protein